MADEKDSKYRALLQELRALLTGERDLIANAANTAALLYQRLDEVNWVGFYFLRDGELVIGPFQGLPACVRIALNEGVCGAAATHRKTLVVADVHAYPGHIACDGASRSEVVVPIYYENVVAGVLDIDSPLLNRFDAADGQWLEKIAVLFQQLTDVGQLIRATR